MSRSGLGLGSGLGLELEAHRMSASVGHSRYTVAIEVHLLAGLAAKPAVARNHRAAVVE